MYCSVKIISACLVSSVLLFIGSVVLAFVVFPDLGENLIDDQAEFSTDSARFEHFMKPSEPDKFKVYIFQVANDAADILAGGKPILQEIGPFVYKRTRAKNLLEINNDTMTYEEYVSFTFDSAASSPLTDNQLVKVLNLPLMAILHLADDAGQAVPIEDCLVQSFDEKFRDILIDIPINQLLFDGLAFNIMANSNPIQCKTTWDYVDTVTAPWRNVRKNDEESLFSYFHYKSATDENFTMSRGIGGIPIGEITRWNGQNKMDNWADDTICNEVNGNNGLLYHVRLEETNLTVFSPDFCRPFDIKFEYEDSYKDLKGNSFMPDEFTFISSDPKNDCYSGCFNQEDSTTECFLDGVLDLYKCSGGPMVLSFPHFLWSNSTDYDTGILNITDANHKIHAPKFVIEPNTGTVLQSLNRYQLNTVLRPIPSVEKYSHIMEKMFPLLWVEEEISIDDEYLDVLNDNYFNKIKLFDGLRWSFIAVTAVMVIGFSGFLVYTRLV